MDWEGGEETEGFDTVVVRVVRKQRFAICIFCYGCHRSNEFMSGLPVVGRSECYKVKLGSPIIGRP